MVGYIYLAEFVPMVALAFVAEHSRTFSTSERCCGSPRSGRQRDCDSSAELTSFAAACLGPFSRGRASRPDSPHSSRPFESFIQKVIPPELMSSVMALNSIRYSVGAIVSPAIAGIIATQLSVVRCVLDRPRYISRIADAVFMLRHVPPPANAERPSLQAIKKAWQYAFSRQELLGTILHRHRLRCSSRCRRRSIRRSRSSTAKVRRVFSRVDRAGALVASLTSGWTRNIHRHGLMVTVAADTVGRRDNLLSVSSTASR
jgi:hypothetical protein